MKASPLPVSAKSSPGPAGGSCAGVANMSLGGAVAALCGATEAASRSGSERDPESSRVAELRSAAGSTGAESTGAGSTGAGSAGGSTGAGSAGGWGAGSTGESTGAGSTGGGGGGSGATTTSPAAEIGTSCAETTGAHAARAAMHTTATNTARIGLNADVIRCLPDKLWVVNRNRHVKGLHRFVHCFGEDVRVEDPEPQGEK